MSKTSAAQIAANRENARKSIGPKTQEGKERSRQNAVKHGMTAGVVISEELKEKTEERIRSWTKSMRPQSEPEAWLVERAAVDAVRVDAASRCERARTEARLRNDVLYSRAEGISEVTAAKNGMDLMQVHHTEVPTMLVLLRGTRAGCEWLLNRWADLKRRHQAQGEWEHREFFEAQRLSGMSYLDEVVTPVCARIAVEYMLSSKDGVETHQDVATTLNRARWFVIPMSGPGYPPGAPKTIARANERLAGFIDDKIEELEVRLASLREVEDLDDSLAAERMLVDLSAEGKLLHRYEADLVRRVHHSLDQLARIRKSTPEPVSSQPSQPEQPRSQMDVKAPQSFENTSRNEANLVDVMESEPCSPSVPKAPQLFENSSRNEANPPAISVTPSTPPSPILTALAESPVGRLIATRDALVAKVYGGPQPPLPARKARRTKVR